MLKNSRMSSQQNQKIIYHKKSGKHAKSQAKSGRMIWFEKSHGKKILGKEKSIFSLFMDSSNIGRPRLGLMGPSLWRDLLRRNEMGSPVEEIYLFIITVEDERSW